ncbi:hypothetical protein D3C77_598250 [compost metagenome]
MVPSAVTMAPPSRSSRFENSTLYWGSLLHITVATISAITAAAAPSKIGLGSARTFSSTGNFASSDELRVAC